MLANGEPQHIPDGRVQAIDLWRSQVLCNGERVQAGAKECFIRVDVAEPGNDGLVQQERLELTPASVELGSQHRWRERSGEGLRAETRSRRREVVRVHDAAELAGVTEQQAMAVVEVPRGADVRRGGLLRFPFEAAAHAQMNEDCGFIRKLDDDVFRAAFEGIDAAPQHGGPQRSDTGLNTLGPSGIETDKGAPDQPRAEGPDNGFDFWQFGHRRIIGAVGVTQGRPPGHDSHGTPLTHRVRHG